MRLRLYDLRMGRLPSLIGACQGDVPTIARYVNTANRRLVLAKEAGNQGWWGTWAEVAFQASQSSPYVTFGPEVARVESIVVAERPVQLHNQFFEYLEFGNGRFPKHFHCGRGLLAGYTRNNAVTFVDLSNAPQFIAAYPMDAQDIGKSVVFQGADANGSVIYSQNTAGQTITGILVPLTQPFAQSPMSLTQLTGIQKDATVGQVKFYQVDPTTGVQVLLLTMQPWETTASYRRYYFNSLPCSQCPQGNCITPEPITIRSIVKLDLTPIVSDTDYSLIQNEEAIIEECQSIRYSEMDNPTAKTMAAERHLQAIRLLNGELAHYCGTTQPAVGCYPFGSARLERQRVGLLI